MTPRRHLEGRRLAAERLGGRDEGVMSTIKSFTLAAPGWRLAVGTDDVLEDTPQVVGWAVVDDDVDEDDEVYSRVLPCVADGPAVLPATEVYGKHVLGVIAPGEVGFREVRWELAPAGKAAP